MSETDNLFESIVDKKPEQKEVAPKNQPKTQAKQAEKPATENEALPSGKVLVDQATLNELVSQVAYLRGRIETVDRDTERGNPANDWAKLKAKERAQRKEKPSKIIYTEKDGKIIMVTIKRNGAYSSYIGNGKKHKEQLKPLIAQWKKDKVWVDAYDSDEFIQKTISELAALED